MQRLTLLARLWHFLVTALALLAKAARISCFVLLLFGCASSRDPTMARIFEASNVIHVCVRPPNVSKDKRIWGLSSDGTPFFGVREVDLARGNGSAVYVFDLNAPPESAKLLPIPYNTLECPAPPKPRVVAAKVEGKHEEERKEEATKKAEAKKAERPKPLPETKRCASSPEPGQARRRGGSGSGGCTKVLVHRTRTEPVVAESPREARPPEPARLSEDAAREYEDWGLTPADVSALAEDRGRECLERICHARHQNFIPKGKQKPAATHDGQSLSTGNGSGGGGAAKTTVKTTTRSASGSSSSETGSYTNTHASGRTYDGKGSRERSQISGRRIERKTGDQHVATDWRPAPNGKEAFKEEARRLQEHGGPARPDNYNKIESPGKKLLEQEK
ncbi:hypothetical protein [Polyangium sp. y55x31]|uniref:hypothetical protein n=1 Tax=Polyangium sp. y55x31 TaxID=3042688 RepID=UPI0024829097|nr:hypothetical protein [Polyangium sp. y55x31]MDI1478408.1 hypothetical protein [Polyangium sp. y55x31]